MQNKQSKNIINSKITNVDRMLRRLEIKNQDILNEEGEDRSKAVGLGSNFNSRGEQILSPKEIRTNYQNGFYLFKWYQLPLCRKTIKNKLSFWAPISVILAWTFGQYYKKRSPTSLIQKLPIKFYLKAYAAIFTITGIYSFVQSMLLDEFCDIQSPFYQQNETRLSMAKRIRSQINEKKNGAFLREMF